MKELPYRMTVSLQLITVTGFQEQFSLSLWQQAKLLL